MDKLPSKRDVFYIIYEENERVEHRNNEVASFYDLAEVVYNFYKPLLVKRDTKVKELEKQVIREKNNHCLGHEGIISQLKKEIRELKLPWGYLEDVIEKLKEENRELKDQLLNDEQ